VPGDHPDPDPDDGDTLDADRLRDALATFGGGPGERRAVARAASDLAADGRLRADRDTDGPAVTVSTVLAELRAAPDGGPADRWNWWVGSLVVAYGDEYAAFGVRRYDRDE
jgi:hypothetical protein